MERGRYAVRARVSPLWTLWIRVVVRTLAILGGGGHGWDLAAIVRRNGEYEFVGFYDDHVDCLGKIDDFDPHHSYLIGVNDPATRAAINGRWAVHGRAIAPAIIDPSAAISSHYWLHVGVVIAALTQIGPRVELGPHTHIGPGVTITRTTVGAYCTISPGATICGDVTIGDRTLIGAGAVVKNLVTIGSDVTVGAGAVVVDDVPDGVTVTGVPARSR